MKFTIVHFVCDSSLLVLKYLQLVKLKISNSTFIVKIELSDSKRSCLQIFNKLLILSLQFFIGTFFLLF